MDKRNAVIYTRISTIDQSASAQLEALLQGAEAQGLCVLAVFSDAVGGKTESREARDELFACLAHQDGKGVSGRQGLIAQRWAEANKASVQLCIQLGLYDNARAMLDDYTLVAAREGQRIQSVFIFDVSRWSRSVYDCIGTVQRLAGYGASLHSLTQGMSFDIANPMSEFMLGMLTMFAQWELSIRTARTRRGMEYAKLHGTRSGKPIGRKKGQVVRGHVDKLKHRIEAELIRMTPVKDIATVLGVSRSAVYNTITRYNLTTSKQLRDMGQSTHEG